MGVMDPEAREFFEELREEYFSRLESRHGVTTAQEYLDCLDRVGNIDVGDDVAEFLSENERSLDSFFQVSPYIGQDILYGSLNPGISEPVTAAELESGQHADHHRTAGDVDELSFHVASYFHGYMQKSGPKEIISTLRDEIDSLPNNGSPPHEEFVSVENKEGISDSYFGQVFHTRFFKLQSPDKDFVRTFDTDHWRRRFADEIQLADPTLIISGCKDIWRSVYDELVQNPKSEIDAHNGSTVTSSYSNTSDDSAVPGVFEIASEDMWVVNVFHERYDHLIDFEQLQSNLAYVNEQVSI